MSSFLIRSLAPGLQEAILFLPPVTTGHDPIHERQLRANVAALDWGKQRRIWARLSAHNA